MGVISSVIPMSSFCTHTAAVCDFALFFQGNLPECGQACHTQNRRVLSISDQSYLPADCLLALVSQLQSSSCHSASQVVSLVMYAAGLGLPLPLAIVPEQDTAGA